MKTPVVLITGASQGIGEAIAKVFAKEVRGVRLALVARNETKLQAVARAGGKVASVSGAGWRMFPSKSRAGSVASACATQPRIHTFRLRSASAIAGTSPWA